MTEHAISHMPRYLAGKPGPAIDRNGLEILTRDECLALLGASQVGRVAVSRYALPAILPVNFAMLGDDIVFATGTGSKSLAIDDETVIAFEVDAIDPADRTGWSVLAVGKARPFDERDPDVAAARELDLHPWVGRHAVDLIRMPTERLTGRRLIESAEHKRTRSND
jgi:nitroimidazol reductase NimA-like FMN-containing flavoprotein (pyridoxamine 5'-phosphate oxidase superfamily)